MKLLTIAIPCYNSAEYMEKCIDGLLAGGEEVEILIVNDGSTKDNTGEIADTYAAKYPTICKALHKENGGHGSAVNMGMEHATGLYFKVVDSDDWVDQDAYQKILNTLREMAGKEPVLDMLISNFVYEKEGAKHKKLMHYHHMLPEKRMFTWEECKHFTKGHYILMHSVIYRTQLLRDCGLRLPEHTFYVDNIYVYEPMLYVKNMYYLDVDFYRYYIGREGQSVNEGIMISRIDQQLKVNKIMIDFYVKHREEIQGSKRRDQYMKNYLEIITTVSSILAIKSGEKTNLEKKAALWQYLKEQDAQLHHWMRLGIMGIGMNLPGTVGRSISVAGYKICQKIFKFN
ncbi:MAG: glycosyltransferase family 2 protein [Lachnospiraceae bacterium]|nr:glycosyltransferase family 2 protein [Lachnospiraceae bacterium]